MMSFDSSTSLKFNNPTNCPSASRNARERVFTAGMTTKIINKINAGKMKTNTSTNRPSLFFICIFHTKLNCGLERLGNNCGSLPVMSAGHYVLANVYLFIR
jgi:hypothetical protein